MLKHRMAERIRKLREQRGMSQEELSIKTGLSRTYLSMIETGERPGSLNAQDLIAEALGVDPGLLAMKGDSFDTRMAFKFLSLPPEVRPEAEQFIEYLMARTASGIKSPL